MRWRDIRFEKPTAADGNEDGEVLQKMSHGSVMMYFWGNITDCIAWMPPSELPAFNPIPDPPEGWRFVEKGEAFDERAKYWAGGGCWIQTGQDDYYAEDFAYIVPVDPPQPPEPPRPKYRPFANGQEFRPHYGKLIREKAVPDHYTTLTAFSEWTGWVSGASIGIAWPDLFSEFEFADGTPFGVEVVG
jgi:hypothetical protein